MADEPIDAPPAEPPSATDVDEARKRVFESLLPEIQRNPEVRRSFGLGDAVAVVAQPIAKLLGIKECGGCKKRQERLNRVKLRNRGAQ